MLLLRNARNGVRSSSTLAERLANAADVSNKESVEIQKHRIETETDKENEPFRELFLKPKRKLQTQITLERMTGRAEQPKFSKIDVFDRMAVRTPRKQEMSTSQDWPSAWPAAQSFRSSVVPLPVRMSYSKVKNGAAIRPPSAPEGNLELVKIPNFLHLTPEHIKRHCEAIKLFCTKFPPELKNDPDLVQKHFPVLVKFSDYVHQSTSLRDIRARVVTTQFKLGDLKLDEHGRDKFKRLVGNRYDEATDTFTLVTDRCYTRKQNREYAEYLVTVLYHECQKKEEWENLKQRVDHLKVEFRGSTAEQRVIEILKKMKSDQTPPSFVHKLDEVHPDKFGEVEELAQFSKTWHEYRNQSETPDSAREYGNAVRTLFGLPPVTRPRKNLVEHK